MATMINIDKLNKRLLLILSVLSVLLLFIYELYFDEYPLYNISSITPSMIGEKVKLCGYVKSLDIKNKRLVFYLQENNSSIKCISFKRINIKDKTHTCVLGSVDVYYGKINIIVDEVINY